jgi:hypothetical protein
LRIGQPSAKERTHRGKQIEDLEGKPGTEIFIAARVALPHLRPAARGLSEIRHLSDLFS